MNYYYYYHYYFYVYIYIRIHRSRRILTAPEIYCFVINGFGLGVDNSFTATHTHTHAHTLHVNIIVCASQRFTPRRVKCNFTQLKIKNKLCSKANGRRVGRIDIMTYNTYKYVIILYYIHLVHTSTTHTAANPNPFIYAITVQQYIIMFTSFIYLYI